MPPLEWLLGMVGSTGAETRVVALRSMAAISLALTVTMVPLTAPSAVEPSLAAAAEPASSPASASLATRLVLAMPVAGGAVAPSPPRKAAAASSPMVVVAAAAAGWLARPIRSAGGGMALLTHLHSVGGQLPALPLAQLERQKPSVTW